VKANSSGWIKDTFPHLPDFTWQAGYAAFSVSYSQLEVVNGYIARQEEHHGGISYQDELRGLLRDHGVAFDERYIWE